MNHSLIKERADELINEERETFISILPPSDVPAPLSGAQKMIESTPQGEALSLEIAGEGGRVTFGVRCRDADAAWGQLESHFPQARLSLPGIDPIRPREGERAMTTVLTVSGAEPLPLRTFEDERILREGSDPLLGIAGAIQSLGEGERVLVRNIAKSKKRGYFEKYRLDALSGPGGANEQSRATERDEQRTQKQTSSDQLKNLGLCAAGLGMAMVIVFVLSLFNVGIAEIRDFLEEPNPLEWVIVGAVGVGAMLVTFFIFEQIAARFRTEKTYYDPRLIEDRVDHSPYDLEIQVIVFVPDSHNWKTRSNTITGWIEKAYRVFDRELGSSIARAKSIDGTPGKSFAFISKRGLLGLLSPGSSSVIGSRELAGLWHLPATGVRPRSVARASSRRWPVDKNHINRGAPVGLTTAGERRLVRIDEDASRSHQFCLAASGMGKTTYMTHLVHHAMRQKARGEHDGAIVVVDPHGGLVKELLGLVPPEVAHKVRLIDLGDESRVVGINVLSPGFSLSRDATAGLLVRAFSKLWDFWGPNMEDILSHSIKTLYEANSHPDTAPEEAYTLLDARPLWLNESFRRKVLARVHDEKMHRFWHEDFPIYERGDRERTLNPIANRLRDYDDSEIASAIVGQRFSTVDLKASIREGNIVLVSTAVHSEGEEVASLIGAYFLSTIDRLIRSQGELAEDDRQRVMVAVDEMETISGVPYEQMLNEWRKFGGSLLLATQTLAGIRRISPSLETSLLTNVGALVCFRVSGRDAEVMARELGENYVSEDDIISLDRHQAYVRLGHGRRKLPPFSMETLPLMLANGAMADELQAKSARYSQRFETVYNRQQAEIRESNELNAAASERRRRR